MASKNKDQADKNKPAVKHTTAFDFRHVQLSDFAIEHGNAIPERKNRVSHTANFCPGSKEYKAQQQLKKEK